MELHNHWTAFLRIPYFSTRYCEQTKLNQTKPNQTKPGKTPGIFLPEVIFQTEAGFLIALT